MGKVKDRQFWESARYNNYSFRQYYNRLVELSLSMFEWENLPESVDPRFLELALFTDGKVLFFKDDELGYLTLRCATSGVLDEYNVPTMRRAYASNGYNNTLDENNSVIIYNNFLRTNSMLDVENFSRRLYNIDRTIDVNINAQKTPVLIVCESETQKLSLLNLYKSYEGNEPVIYSYNNLSKEPLKAISTGAPYVADKLTTLKTQIWNEALTYLGISNVSFTKKERMISDEVMRSQGGVVASRYSRLVMRQRACEQINKMFPELNVKCSYREDVRVFWDGEEVEEKNMDLVGGEEL